MLSQQCTTKIWITCHMKSNFFSIPIVAIVLVVAVVIFEFLPIDGMVQPWLYNANTQTWLVDRNDPVLDLVFYSGIKKIFVASILFLLFALVFLRRFNWVKNHSKGLVIVVLSAIVIPLTVGVLKDTTNMPCPNQLVEYNGPYPHIGLFEQLTEQQQRPVTRCYPAGHASGGFSLLALLFLVTTSRSKKIILAAVMTLGWSTAIYKMAIGDHFLGHGVVTMILAWLIILMIVAGVEKIETIFFNKNISR